MRRLLAWTALAAGIALAAPSADAREFRLGPAAPPAHPANGVMYTNFMKYLPEESDGRLSGVIIGPEVVSLLQVKDALQTGIIEVGNLLPLYFPADFPMMSVTGQLSLIGTDSQAMAAAVTEYIVNCAPCQAEMKKQGLVYLGSGASDVYEFLTTKPIRKVEDLKGLRLRSGGAPWARLAENFGATPVQMSVFDQFEAISQGAIDGTMASIADMLSFRLVEVVKYVTYAPLGLYHSTSDFTVTKFAWDELAAEDRAAMARAANRANADFTHRWGAEMPAAAEQAAKDAGVELIAADAALTAALAAYVQDDIKIAADYSKHEFRIDDAAEQIAAFLDLVRKWEAISSEIGDDPAAMAERVEAEVWSKVDYASYGN